MTVGGASLADGRSSAPGPDYPYLVMLLVALTAVSGMVDALSFLTLGRVFTANMTGNVVLLGFSLTGVRGISLDGSLLSLGAFSVGALVGGRLTALLAETRHRWLGIGMAMEAALLLAAAFVLAGPRLSRLGVALLALAMGYQGSTARSLKVPDLTTVVVTTALTGLVADTQMSGGRGSAGHRLLALGAMLGGAIVGAVLLHVHRVAPLLGAVMVLASATVVYVVAARRLAGTHST